MTDSKYRLASHCLPSIVVGLKSKPAKSRASKHKFTYSISRAVKNKPESHESKIYNNINRSLEVIHNGSIDSLIQHIKSGHVITCVFNGTRKRDNFKETDIVLVDIDKGWSSAGLSECSLVKNNAAFFYTTPSHTNDNPRFRVVFILERTIKDPKIYELLMRGLAKYLSGDKSCTDAARIFFGNDQCQIFLYDNLLSNNKITELVEMGDYSSSSAQSMNSDGSITFPRKSSIRLPRDQVLQSKDGLILLSDAKVKTPVHCPVHYDRSPSAFVLENKNKTCKGVYCSSCGCTYWMINTGGSSNTPNYNFYLYENALLEIEFKEYLDNDLEPDDGGFEWEKSQPVIVRYDSRYLGEIDFFAPTTMLTSPKGTGKTQSLKLAVQKFKDSNYKVLLVGHRRALLASLAIKLGLHCYLSDSNEDMSPEIKECYAISLDSITKKLNPEFDQYDVVIIDEAEQVFKHFSSKTLGSKRRATYLMLKYFVNKAKHVILSDADLGPLSVEFIHNARHNSDVKFYINQFKNNNRIVNVYDNKSHMIDEMIKAISAGGCHYIPCNSKKQALQIEAILSQIGYPSDDVMCVTSKNSNEKSVMQQISNIVNVFGKSKKVLICSPTIGTGIDISFKDNQQVVDATWGFFQSGLTSHFDCDQQIARVRNPGMTNIYVSPKRDNYECNVEAIKAALIKSDDFSGCVKEYSDEGKAIYDTDDELLTLHSIATSINLASINNLKLYLLAHLKREGAVLNVIKKDNHAVENVSKLIKDAKTVLKNAEVQDVLSAKELTPMQFSELKKRSYLTHAEVCSLVHYQIKAFYGMPLTEALIVIDDGGKYRSKMRNFALLMNSENAANMLDHAEAEKKLTVVDKHFYTKRRQLLIELLVAAGVYDEKRNLFDENKVYTKHDLNEFVKACEKNKLELQSLFKKALPIDLHTKPCTFLGRILNLIGLKHCRTAKTKDGIKTYYYQLDSFDITDAGLHSEVYREATTSSALGWQDDYDDDFIIKLIKKG